MGQSRVTLPERESCTPDPEGSTKCRHFLPMNAAHTWPISTDTARSRRRSNWAPSREVSLLASSNRPGSPHDFSIITPGCFVRLSNLRIDRILAGPSSQRLALFEKSSRLAVARQTLSRLTAKLYSLGHACRIVASN